MNTCILHVLDHLQPSAALSRLTLLAQRLAADGYGAPLYVASLERIKGRPECMAGASRLEAAGASVMALSQATGLDPLAPFRLRRLVHRLQPQIVHVWQPASLSWSRMAANGRNLVASIDHWPGRYDRWMLSLMRLAVRQAAAVVVPDEIVARHVRRHLGVREAVFDVIAPGVQPPQNMQESAVARQHLLRTAGLPSDARMIVAAGRLVAGRRIRDAIWNIDILTLLFPNAYLVVLGDGPQKRRLQAFNRAMRGWAQTRFVSWQNAADWWPHAELVFHFDDEPGISQCLLEAMAVGTPAIVSDSPSHRAFLEDGVHATFAALSDRTSLAKCGRRLLLNPAAAAEMAAAGQERVLQQFDAARFAEAHRRLYQRLAASTPQSAAARSA